MVTQDAFLDLYDERRISAELIRELRVDNPLRLIMEQLAPWLAPAVTVSLSQGYQREADVPRYPLESGGTASDHALLRGLSLRMTGAVSQSAQGGTGPADVAAEFNRAMTERTLVTAHTAYGTFENCVIKSFGQTQTSQNARTLEFAVTLEQISLGTVTSAPDLQPVTQPGENNAALLDERQTGNLEIDTNAIISALASGQPLAGTLPGIGSPVATDILTSVQLAAFDTPLITAPVPEDLNAKAFVRDQWVALAEDGIERPEYPESFARQVGKIELKRYELQFGTSMIPGVPLAGVDLLRIPLGNPSDDSPQSWSGTLGDVRLEMQIASFPEGTGRRWVVNLLFDIPRGLRTLRDALSGIRTIRQNGVRLHGGVPLRLREGWGALIAIPLGAPSVPLGRQPWGNTHGLIFTTNLDFINGQVGPQLP